MGGCGLVPELGRIGFLLYNVSLLGPLRRLFGRQRWLGDTHRDYIVPGLSGYGIHIIGLGKGLEGKGSYLGAVPTASDSASIPHPLQTLTAWLVHEREPLSLVTKHEARGVATVIWHA